MPREQINFPVLASPDDPPRDRQWGPWNDAAVHVGWHVGIGAFVQVGLEVDVNYAEFCVAHANGATGDRTVLWTPVLTANEAERLIKTLRKAVRKIKANRG